MPDLVKPVAEVLSAMIEPIVKPAPLYWWTTRSAPDAPRNVPPVMVPPAVAVDVIKIPPVVIVLVPVRVNVLAVLLLKRMLLGVIPAFRVWLEVTSMFSDA